MKAISVQLLSVCPHIYRDKIIMLVIGNQNDSNFETVKEVWARASKVIVLTGAGISTSCGIPDFRSSNGLSKRSVRDTLQSLHDALLDRFDFEGRPVFTKMGENLFANIPTNFLTKASTELFQHTVLHDPATATALYRFSVLLKEFILQTVNRASELHALVNQLKEEGRLAHWFTQNIDGLEALSGCRIYTGLEKWVDCNGLDFDPTLFEVIQMHGSLETAWCSKSCHVEEMNRDVINEFFDGFEVPCPRCPTGTRRPRQPGYLRPGIQLYQDPHPSCPMRGAAVTSLAEYDVQDGADLLFIAGTSLKVYGAANLVQDVSVQLRRRQKQATKRECVIMVGMTLPAQPLHEFIDIFLQMDCDELAKSLAPVEATGRPGRAITKSENLVVSKASRVMGLLLG